MLWVSKPASGARDKIGHMLGPLYLRGLVLLKDMQQIPFITEDIVPYEGFKIITSGLEVSYSG